MSSKKIKRLVQDTGHDLLVLGDDLLLVFLEILEEEKQKLSCLLSDESSLRTTPLPIVRQIRADRLVFLWLIY